MRKASEPKKRFVGFKLTEAERQTIQSEARRRGLTISDVLRALIRMLLGADGAMA